MPINASQSALIARIKSFVKNTGRRFGSGEQPKVTEEMARKIQLRSYEKKQHEYPDTFTPPYLSLVKQLEVDNYQIFCAAVFNMTEIAENNPDYRLEIIEHLQKVRTEKQQNPEMVEFVDEHLKKLNKLK